MIDLTKFKDKGYMIDLDSQMVTVSLPLTIPEFRAVLNDYKTQEEGLKALSYVANIAHYGSSVNIIGLTGSERREDIKLNLGLSKNFKETNKIKLAILKFDEHYSKGVFGLLKELNISYEVTRSSIAIINESLNMLLHDVQNAQRLKTDTPETIMTKIKSVMDATGAVRGLTNGLSGDIQSLKDLEGLLLSEIQDNIQLYGGGRVPLSSQVND